MKAFAIEDLKECTLQLFVKETFDAWLVREVSVVTFNTFTIDGHIRQGYYTDEELEEKQIEEMSAWKVLRPFCFSLIKGKKLPGSFQITLQLPPKETAEFLTGAGLDLRPEQVAGLYLYFRYEDNRLLAITGTSLKIFTMDRQTEIEWDEYVKRYLKEQGLAFTEA